MTQEMVKAILAIEQEAAEIQAQAQRQADRMIAEAQDEATALRERVLAEAHTQADELVAAGKQSAEAERTRVIAGAEEEALRFEAAAQERIDAAVAFVVERVTGRG